MLIVVSTTAGTSVSTRIQTVLPSVIIVAVIGNRSRIVVGVSRPSAVIGVARIAADSDQTDIAATGVAVAGIAVTAVVTATVSPPVPRVIVTTARGTTATVRITYANITVTIATNTLETKGATVIATAVTAIVTATAAVTAQQIPKAVTRTAAGRTTATAAIEAARITSIAHSISILLVYLRRNLIVQYMHSEDFSLTFSSRKPQDLLRFYPLSLFRF